MVLTCRGLIAGSLNPPSIFDQEYVELRLIDLSPSTWTSYAERDGTTQGGIPVVGKAINQKVRLMSA